MAHDGELKHAPRAARLENLTLWQRVYEYLREEIVSERLQPGTELQEVPLSEELGVSRGPIREAIGRLAAEGLVTVRPRRGAIVRSLSKDEFLELYQVREALEMMAVRLAVPNLDGNDFAGLDELIARMSAHAERDEVEEFFAANVAFHGRILAACGNTKLQELYAQLLGQMGPFRLRSLTLRGNLQRSVSEHRAILSAARRGDAERAAHLMSEHIRVPQRRLEALTEADLTGVPA
jgi:DNA-binding GntR family transcriptional regulator